MEHFWTLADFQPVACIALAAHRVSSSSTPTLPCKSSSSHAAEEHAMSFHPRLLCASAPPAATTLFSAGWNSLNLMIFLLAITLSLHPPARFKAPGKCVPFYS